MKIFCLPSETLSRFLCPLIFPFLMVHNITQGMSHKNEMEKKKNLFLKPLPSDSFYFFFQVTSPLISWCRQASDIVTSAHFSSLNSSIRENLRNRSYCRSYLRSSDPLTSCRKWIEFDSDRVTREKEILVFLFDQSYFSFFLSFSWTSLALTATEKISLFHFSFFFRLLSLLRSRRPKKKGNAWINLVSLFFSFFLSPFPSTRIFFL